MQKQGKRNLQTDGWWTIMKKVLKIVRDRMKSNEINYHFQRYKTSVPQYPYFIGEILPVTPTTEDGMKEYTLVLQGFNRETEKSDGTLFGLLEESDKIEKLFPSVEGFRTVIDNQAIAVFFCSCQPIESGESQLQKIEIQMTIKTWKG